MTNAEAVRMLAVLAASFRQEINDETAVLWARDLANYEVADALEAVELCRKTQIYMPSLAEFLAVVRDVRNARVMSERALPPATTCCDGQGFGHFYRDHCDPPMRSRIDRLLEPPPKRRRDHTIQMAFARVVGS